MTDPIYRCEEHGFATRRPCPRCGREGRAVLPGERRERLSKFLSGALRHFPGDVGLSLDSRGWVDRDDLAAAASERYDWADAERVGAVIATDPKGRFETDGDRVRAAYGHSVDVTLDDGTDDPDAAPIPDRLYHGTAPRALPAIRREGLRPMDRREVHLSETAADAREVGSRHAADPAVLVVDAAAMLADGRRICRRGRETYTTDRVPPEYLSRLSV